jgi:AraC-like DNA-binding protein
MHATAEVPTLWDQLAENMYLKGSPAAEVALSAGTSVSFARVRSDTGLPEIGRSIVGEHGYLVALQLKAIPFIEEFFGRRRVSSGSYPVGGVSAIDLRNEPALLLPNPFDALVLYVTQGSLDEVAFAHQAPRVEQLKWPLGGVDLTVLQLGQTLLSSLDRSQRMSRLFLDHVLHALKCHLVWSYGGVGRSAPRFRGGLSSLQIRTATELLDANLEGSISLEEVADACQLSVSHFSRAFRTTFGRPPYKWLIERRVERARDLMTNTRLPLAHIATQSGFADQSALNRSFKRIHGVTPGIWRRTTT